MLNYKHVPTGSTVKTEVSTVGKTVELTNYDEFHVRTPWVSTCVTHYDSLGGWQAQSVHLYGPPQPEARMNQRDDGTTYLTVQLGQHDTLFVPMSIATAIADALVNEEVAS